MEIHDKILKKFGYPESIIKEYKYWSWLLRPKQITLGSSVLICNNYYENFSDLPKENFLELTDIIFEIESKLKSLFSYKKINYLMLMMEDPTVHFHVIPRYDRNMQYRSKIFKDPGYPNAPNLGYINNCTMKDFMNIIKAISNS